MDRCGILGLLFCLTFHFVANLPQNSNTPGEKPPESGADIKRMPSKNGVTNMKSWKFKVKYESRHAEKVCITGDCDLLGNWAEENIIPLSYNESSKLWHANVNIPADRDVHYRYFTCTSEVVNEKHLKTKIHQWETSIEPREVKKEQKSNDSDDEYDIFGKFDNTEKLENGWLIDDVAIYLRLNSTSIEWTSEEAIGKKIFIKVRSAQQGKNAESSKHVRSRDIILISSRSEGGKYREQDADGYAYHDGELAVFMTRTFTFDNQGFVFEFTDIAEGRPNRTFYSHLVLDQKFRGSMGHIKIPIHSSDQEHLGQLTVNYLIVRSSPPSLDLTFKSSFAKYWNDSWVGLEIGHRGCGKSFSNSASALLNAKHRENTIGSFKSAGQFGANLVEFDVQLTSDLMPTVYHDFNVVLEVQHNNGNSERKLILPFSKLSYEDLKDFKTCHVREINGRVIFESEDGEDSTPFPTLKQVLNSVDPHVGFNIEIKHTSQSQEDGENEFDNPIDMNVYVDKILEVVYENAGLRYIVFSSFSPDICLMARLKQNKYPVMFLTKSVKSPTPTQEELAKNIQTGINFANSADLLGIVAAAEDLLRDFSLIKMISANNLIPFCWGEDVNNNENIEKLKKHGVHGVIFDRVDQLGQKLKKDIMFREGAL